MTYSISSNHFFIISLLGLVHRSQTKNTNKMVETKKIDTDVPLYTKKEVKNLLLRCITASAEDRRTQSTYFLTEHLGLDDEESSNICEEIEFMQTRLCADLMEYYLEHKNYQDCWTSIKDIDKYRHSDNKLQ